MDFIVEPMTLADIPEVLTIDQESYPIPWPAGAYRQEIRGNAHARYYVIRLRGTPENGKDIYTEFSSTRGWRDRLPWPRKPTSTSSDGPVIGYAGMWLLADEAHVTTIAVTTGYRGRGLGEVLLSTLMTEAKGLGMRWVTLEVRTTNEVAKNLYTKYGFHQAGLRKRYYSDNNEDALIMSTDDITLNALTDVLSRLQESLRVKLGEQGITVDLRNSAAVAG